MNQWVKPRRTMTPPPSLNPCRRVHVPNVTEIAMKFPIRPTVAEEVSGATSEEFNAADMVISYSPSEFSALRGNANLEPAPSAVLDLAVTLREDNPVGSPRTTSPTPALGLRAAQSPVTKSDASRKRYFDHSELHHKVLAVLNKVSSDAEKYAQVRNELHRLPLPTATDDQLKRISETFFQKATSEPKFAGQYASLVAELAVSPPGKATVDETKTLAHRLRVALISRCQSEFERTRRLLWEEADAEDADEVDRHRKRYRETLRFVGQLYLHRVLSKEVIRTIVLETLPPFDVPAEYDIDGVCALLTTVGETFIADEPTFVTDVVRRIASLASEAMSTRAQCLLMNTRDLLTPKLPTALQTAVVEYRPPTQPSRRMDPDHAMSLARKIFFDLAATDDYDKALEQLLQAPDVCAVLHHAIGRALTTPRADKERQQLPAFLRMLVELRVLSFPDAQTVVFERIRECVDGREWLECPKLWKHWAQLLVEDTRPLAVMHQTMHTDTLLELALSTTYEPADVWNYIATVVLYNEDRVWDLDTSDPVRCPRFRYLSVLVAVSSFDDLETEPLRTVARLFNDGKLGTDIEARVFMALCTRQTSGLFEELCAHDHLGHPLLVQKVAGAILAAAVAMQDIEIVLESMDLLHVVVDAPKRGIREALLLSEIIESGSRMHMHLRSSGFGFQIAKALKDREVVSEYTLQEALKIYSQHPHITDLLGPCVGQPFISTPQALLTP